MSLTRFTHAAMEFWRNQFRPIEANTRRTAEATERIDAARGRGEGIAIEGVEGGEPLAVTFEDSGAQPITTEQLPSELGAGGGVQVEGAPDGLPVNVKVVEGLPLTAAVYVTGTLAFGSVTTTYALLLSPPAGLKLLTLFNGTDKAVFFSFDAATPAGYLPPYSSQDFAYAAAGLRESRSVYIKHAGVAPTTDAVYGNGVC